MKKAILSNEAPAAIGPYSQAITAGGMIYVSGMLGIDPASGALKETVAEQELNLEENTIPGSGTFLVGEDIEPGTYRSSGAEYCVWDRLSGLGGHYDEDVIVHGYSEGTAYVNIAESDMAFSSEGCADWIRQ